MQSPAAETLQELLQGRGFAASVTQLPRASSMLEVLWPGGCKGRHPAPRQCFGSPLNVGCKRDEVNLTTCQGRGFTLPGAGLGFEKLAWAGLDCEAPKLRRSAAAWFPNVVKHPSFLKQGVRIWGAGKGRCVKSWAALGHMA